MTKPPSKDKVDGLTVYDVSKLKASFKGGEVNDAKGETVIVDWEISDTDDDSIRFSKNDMLKMKAEVGDLVYLCDNRKWLGGLKSIHSVYGEPHDTDGVVMITNNQQQSGLFDQNRKLFGEKKCSLEGVLINHKFPSFFVEFSGVAQLVEQVAVNHFVGGSSPSSGAE